MLHILNFLTPGGGPVGGRAEWGLERRPQRAALLPLQPGVLRRNDWVWQQWLSHRVVPFRLSGHHHQTQGQVVLPPLCSIVQEEAMIKNELDVGARSTNIDSSEVFWNAISLILFCFYFENWINKWFKLNSWFTLRAQINWIVQRREGEGRWWQASVSAPLCMMKLHQKYIELVQPNS